MKNVAYALGLLLFAAYFLTASGHTYSPDEEALIYVTQSFVTRGDFTIPNAQDYPVVGGHRGHGKIYSGTGLAQSLMAAPLYVAGSQIANAFNPHLRTFILRLVMVSSFNALLTALTGVLLWAWLRRLRISARISLAVVLIWAFATMAWIYARTFYSEPLLTFCFVLAGYALCTFHDTRAMRWMIVAGLAAGLATLAKLQGVLVLPALALYFLALELPTFVRQGALATSSPAAPHLILQLAKSGRGRFLAWQSLFGPGLLFVLALACGVGLAGYYNYIRFDDALQSGYGQVSQDSALLTGLYGLLLSPGKSVFLYAPPLILSLFALPRFFKRHLAEALFCLGLITTFVVFHARLYFWSGDGAWGPRYMVSTLPFWILPIGMILGEWWHSRWQRVFVLALVVAGLVVNALALAINFDTYIQVRPDADARYFEPAASPLLGQWKLWRAHLDDWAQALVSSQNAVVPVRGFLATGDDAAWPRYLAPRATLLIKSDLGQPLQLTLLALDYRADNQEKRRLAFLANGAPLEARRLPEADSGALSYEVQIPANLSPWAPVDIVTLGTKRTGKSPQGDELGVHLQSLEVQAGGHALTLTKYIAIPPLPTANPKDMWAWFYLPAFPQFDFYAWYLYFSGMDDAQILATVAVFVLVGGVCFGLSVPTLRRV